MYWQRYSELLYRVSFLSGFQNMTLTPILSATSTIHTPSCFTLNFFLTFYLFIFRERGRKGEREGVKPWCEKETSIGCLPNLQPRHGSWPGIELVTFHFAERCPTNWAIPVRAEVFVSSFQKPIYCVFMLIWELISRILPSNSKYVEPIWSWIQMVL